MTIREMTILLEVAKYNNMSAASRTLYISQSTVSQTILDIEKAYNVKLFERLSKKLVITEQGKIFIDYSKKIIGLYTEMEEAIKNSLGKVIRIGTTLITISSILNEIWSDYHYHCPDVKTKMIVDDNYILKNKLLNGEIDFVLTEEIFDHEYLVCSKIAEDDFVFIYNEHSEFCNRSSISLKDLSEHPLIMREKGNSTREYFEHALAARGYKFQLKEVYRNIDSIKFEVNNSKAYSIMAKKLFINDVKLKNLRYCTISDMVLKRYFYIVYHKDTFLPPHFKKFIRVCHSIWNNQTAD